MIAQPFTDGQMTPLDKHWEVQVSALRQVFPTAAAERFSSFIRVLVLCSVQVDGPQLQHAHEPRQVRHAVVTAQYSPHLHESLSKEGRPARLACCEPRFHLCAG